MSSGVVSNCVAHTQAYVSIILVRNIPSEEVVSNCPAYTKPNVSNFRALLNIYYYITIGHPQLLTARGGLRRDAPCARSLGGKGGCKQGAENAKTFRAPMCHFVRLSPSKGGPAFFTAMGQSTGA